MTFQPDQLPPATQAIVGGSSFTSQHALDAHFGMGKARFGTVEVQWPGGVRNRLYRVRVGERLVLPEIPCSIDSEEHRRSYRRCVSHALYQLRYAGVLDRHQARRLQRSGMRAFREERAHRRGQY